jgi:hypothetical protein
MTGRVARRSAAAAAAVAVLYVAAIALPMAVSGHRVRPLYEGFTPPPPYRWVKPPAEFKAGNQQPVPGDGEVAFTGTGQTAKQTSVVTGDSQVVLNLPDKSFDPRGSDTAVHVHIQPLDPATLGPAPAGLQPDGNAYRIDAQYRPSNAPVTALTTAGDAFFVVPSAATAMLYSADGRTWQRLGLETTGRADLAGVVFGKTGFYEAAQPPNAATRPAPSKGGNTGRVVLLVGLGVVLALAVLLGPSLVNRRKPPAKKGARRR